MRQPSSGSRTHHRHALHVVTLRGFILAQFGDIFAQWGLRGSPFAVEALKSDARGELLLRGRDDDIREVMNKLHRRGRITCIDGQYGIGKTSLVNVATYKCLQAFKRGDTAQVLLPCKTSFQLREDLDVDGFTRQVLYHVVLTVQEHAGLLQALCEQTGFEDFQQWISSPVLRFDALDVSNAVALGVPGIATWSTGVRGTSAAATNNSDGFVSVGFEVQVKQLLERLFTSVSGGIVCVIDNVELLETASKARRTLELLRDRLLTIPGLRWVFCGANGVIHSLASSPRLSAFLNTPVLELKNVRTIDLKDLIWARLEEYAPKPEVAATALPFEMPQIEWLYEVLNYNLRDLLSHLEQYCEHIALNRIMVTKEHKGTLFRKWIKDFGQFNYQDISKKISQNAWLVLDAAMSDDFKGSFGAGQFSQFNRNSLVTVTEETFQKWLRDLRKYDILTKSLPEEMGDDQSEIELETYSVTSKGALIFYYRQREKQNLTLSTHEWLRRVHAP